MLLFESHLLIVSQVCNECRDKKDRPPCVVTWHKNRNRVTFRCWNCIGGHGACSFRDQKFGITGNPTLLVTETGVERRARQVAIRMGSSKAKIEDSIIPAEKATHPSRTRKKTKKVVAAPSMTLRIRSEGVPVTETHVSSPGVQRSASTSNLRTTNSSSGHEESFFLEDIAAFERFLIDPSQTVSSLLTNKSHLRLIVLREAGQLAALIQHLEDRREMADLLLARFDRRVEDIQQLATGSSITQDMMDRQGNIDTCGGMSGKQGEDEENMEDEDRDVGESGSKTRGSEEMEE